MPAAERDPSALIPPLAPTPVEDVPTAAALAARLAARNAAIGVIGLGYVGLPLARAAGSKGFRVTGFDIDPAKVEMLRAGRSYIRHVPAASLAALAEKGLFAATADFGRLTEMDAILICVPTPLTRYREPDLSFVQSTTAMVARHLRRGQLIVLESTTYPGTCREVMKPLLEAGGLVSGRDFFLAYSPEREDPGNPSFDTGSIPKVVGGDGPDALALACALYDQIVVRTVSVSTLDVAEAVKLSENIFRAVNIALVNELKLVYGAMGIDVWEVIEAAKSKPFGFMPFYPGPGLGGHCIPIDPFYLTWKAREYGIATRFIELAGEINTNMPRHLVERLVEALDRRQQRGLSGSRILILGLAYKKNVEDIRESPALRLIEMLEARGARVDFFDPYVAEIPPTREHAGLRGRRSISWSAVGAPEALAGYHAGVIVTDHDEVDYATLVARLPLVVDSRNACERKGIRDEKVIKA
jgi:UDP-N-acetyl-D-glucosamine dehydrogenase